MMGHEPASHSVDSRTALSLFNPFGGLFLVLSPAEMIFRRRTGQMSLDSKVWYFLTWGGCKSVPLDMG